MTVGTNKPPATKDSAKKKYEYSINDVNKDVNKFNSESKNGIAAKIKRRGVKSKTNIEGQSVRFFGNRFLQVLLERNFGLQFAFPRGIWRIRQITAEICRICQICPATLKTNLNCNCSSENSPIRRSSKMTLGNGGS
jgi:hypothetical protein